MNRYLAASVGAAFLCLTGQGSPAFAQALPNCGTHGLTMPSPANSHAPTESAYPLISTALGEEGDTYLQFEIGKDGTVNNPSVTKSSGSLRLDDAAIALTKGWLYIPALSGGQPAACLNTASVRWRLHPVSGSAGPLYLVAMSRGDYPSGAFAKGEQGMTVILTVTSAKGEMVQSVSRSSGYPDLDTAALAIAARKVKLPPGTYDGKPVGAAMIVLMVWSTAAPLTPVQIQKDPEHMKIPSDPPRFNLK
jgi:TonB family protein